MEDNLKQEEFWNRCLSFIKDRVEETTYQTWFDVIRVAALQKEDITLLVPSKFHYEWLESKYRHLIDDAIKNIMGFPLVVNYSVPVSSKSTTEIPKFDENSEQKILRQNYLNIKAKSNLNERYTFDSFIEGKGNQFAKAAAVAIGEKPGQTPFNPLMIYSSTGLGKTHLIQALGNFIIRSKNNFRVTYMTSERFMFEFIRSIQNNRSTDFTNQYKKTDMLLIDDVQFFEGKEQTQEQFFHLFNNLYQEGKQIVLSIDRHPNELVGIKDRLISRFKSGLIVDIQPPNLETRIAILMADAKINNLDINYKITEFIASSITDDVRIMKSVLIRLLALSSLRHEDITMSLTKGVLSEMVGGNLIQKVTVKQIIKYVCKKLDVSERIVRGKSRVKNVAIARQIIMFISRELTELPLAQIGSQIGGRDHSTIIHGCKSIEKIIKDDISLNKNINTFIDELSTKKYPV